MENEHPTIKKLAVVFEEVFKRANNRPPDTNAKEEPFVDIPWYLRIFYRRRKGKPQ